MEVWHGCHFTTKRGCHITTKCERWKYYDDGCHIMTHWCHFMQKKIGCAQCICLKILFKKNIVVLKCHFNAANNYMITFIWWRWMNLLQRQCLCYHYFKRNGWTSWCPQNHCTNLLSAKLSQKRIEMDDYWSMFLWSICLICFKRKTYFKKESGFLTFCL